MWTQFWDMHSGGGLKEPPYHYIYIEAPEAEAKVIFYNRFGHNPERVTCTCCGDDYSISEGETLAQLTGYRRNCRNLETPKDPKTGRSFQPTSPAWKKHYYLEEGEKAPRGFKVSTRKPYGKYQTLEAYKQNEDVLIIPADEIKPEERVGTVPEQGYVWQE